MILITSFLDVALLLLLVVTALAIVRMKDLLATVMLSGIYGLLAASFFVVMDAVDVAFTEASVGAGVFPLLMLAVLAFVGRYEAARTTTLHYPVLIVTVLAGLVLLAATTEMPAFGSAEAPAQQHVSVRYIEESPQEIGIPNMVTSVLASYRGFDTLGEVVVIFTAAIGVMVILAGIGRRDEPVLPAEDGMKDHMVLRVVGKILIPLILLFALYVQFHGEYGPGGGFQAGVIFAAGIILYAMLFGLENAQRVLPLSVLRLLTALGVMLYGSVGIASLIGGNFLDYSVLADDPVAGQHLGILLIELGVGITVAASMVLIFFVFSLAANPRNSARH